MTNICTQCLNEGETKEGFCIGCLAIPLALAGGAGAAATSANMTDDEKKKHKKKMVWKKILFWGSIALTIISVFIFIYFKFIKKNCKSCNAKSRFMMFS